MDTGGEMARVSIGDRVWFANGKGKRVRGRVEWVAKDGAGFGARCRPMSRVLHLVPYTGEWGLEVKP